MDEEVHNFVNEYTPPLNTRMRSNMPFIPNGSNPSAFSPAGLPAFAEGKHHRKPDINERGIDEEVYHFASDAIPPLNTRARSNYPFVPNGSAPSAHSPAGLPAFAEGKHNHQGKPDIAERGMDEEVYHFAKAATKPLNTRLRSNYPFVPNGSDPSAHNPELPFDEGEKEKVKAVEKEMAKKPPPEAPPAEAAHFG
jgi:hypothetical protein